MDVQFFRRASKIEPHYPSLFKSTVEGRYQAEIEITGSTVRLSVYPDLTGRKQTLD